MTESTDVNILRPGGQVKPEVRTEVRDGITYLVKDYAPCGAGFRFFMGRWFVRREHAALREAEGILGIPSNARRFGPYSLGYEFIPATPCAELPEEKLPGTFWDDLSRIIDDLHARRIAHGDLKTLENVLVGDDGHVYLIDLTAAVVRRKGPLHILLYPYISHDDRRAVIKAKLILAPEIVTDAEREFLAYQSPAERFFRWGRRPFRKAAKWLGGRRSGPGPGRHSVRRKKANAESEVRGDAPPRDSGEA